ncbi:RHS repeat-associated core domain-containing protein [Oscillatoria sp. CS-180]|uniref:RHS repeat-associated core domain-containing protein n=1 Tax=Oscillatoria sp. CS-180 TaxID=3021720 RepID=UPI0023311CE1|nr:RHS repeat-associated core domain-containing protein [Oscillatoria sp. CS-180]MDB9524571.1 RHS repeat-associated core domain-containing protein [Oscillatoria sp. CS-180]
MTTQTEIATGNKRTFVWDHLNRLIAVIDEDSADIQIQRVDYTYDVMNRRIAKSVDGATTHFVYDRDNVLLEFDGSATVPSMRYLHGPQVDQVLAQEDSGGTQWLLGDHLGTIKDFVDDSVNLLNHRTFDSYGNLVSETNSSVDSRYSFTGREFDAETGLHHYRARYYDGNLGRFISQDPIGFRGGDENLYGYVSNSPINATDPSGRESAQLTTLLQQTRPGNSKRVRIHEPESADYETAFILSTVWFWIITTGPDTRRGGSQTVPWNVTYPLEGGGIATHRPFSTSTPPSPTIQLLEDEFGISHNTNGFSNVQKIRFHYGGNTPNCAPEPVLLRREEESEEQESQNPFQLPEINVPNIPFIIPLIR